MTENEKRHLLDRICSGGYFSELSKTPVYIDLCLSSKQKNYLNYKYANALEKAKIRGVPSEEEEMERLCKNNVLGSEYNSNISRILDEVEKLKDFYYTNFYNDNSKKEIKKKIEKLNFELAMLYRKKEMYISGKTAESYANKIKNRCKYIWMVKDMAGNQLFNENMAIPDSIVNNIENIIFQNIVIQEKLLEIARTYPWRTLWVGSSKNAESIFGRCSSSFSEEQFTLVHFSLYYDNVYEAYSCPPNEIINDDIALEVWFKKEHEKRERENSKNRFSSKVDKHNEVFVTANKDGAKKIYEMNDPLVRKAINKRNKMVENGSDGSEKSLLKGLNKYEAQFFVKDKKK